MSRLNASRSRSFFAAPMFKQRGLVVVVAMIVLIALSLAGVALVRAIETGNIIAGNMAFRQSSLHATDVGLEAAMEILPILEGDIPAESKLFDNVEGDGDEDTVATSNGFYYYATRRVLDQYGMPTMTPELMSGSEIATPGDTTSIDWSKVPAYAKSGDYFVQVVVERMCTGPTVTADNLLDVCMYEPTPGEVVHKRHDPAYDGSNQFYYRVTVRTHGTRNTESYVQAIVGYGA